MCDLSAHNANVSTVLNVFLMSIWNYYCISRGKKSKTKIEIAEINKMRNRSLCPQHNV